MSRNQGEQDVMMSLFHPYHMRQTLAESADYLLPCGSKNKPSPDEPSRVQPSPAHVELLDSHRLIINDCYFDQLALWMWLCNTTRQCISKTMGNKYLLRKKWVYNIDSSSTQRGSLAGTPVPWGKPMFTHILGTTPLFWVLEGAE